MTRGQPCHIFFSRVVCQRNGPGPRLLAQPNLATTGAIGSEGPTEEPKVWTVITSYCGLGFGSLTLALKRKAITARERNGSPFW
jgi:hypothetical protein